MKDITISVLENVNREMIPSDRRDVWNLLHSFAVDLCIESSIVFLKSFCFHCAFDLSPPLSLIITITITSSDFHDNPSYIDFFINEINTNPPSSTPSSLHPSAHSTNKLHHHQQSSFWSTITKAITANNNMALTQTEETINSSLEKIIGRYVPSPWHYIPSPPRLTSPSVVCDCIGWVYLINGRQFTAFLTRGWEHIRGDFFLRATVPVHIRRDFVIAFCTLNEVIVFSRYCCPSSSPLPYPTHIFLALHPLNSIATHIQCWRSLWRCHFRSGRGCV